MSRRPSEGARKRNAAVVVVVSVRGKAERVDDSKVAGINCAASGRSQKKIQEWKRPTMGDTKRDTELKDYSKRRDWGKGGKRER